MSTSPPLPPPLPLDTQNRVAVDARCLTCGYNLRTQPADGLCPECASPVLPSLRGELLHFSDPAWLRRVTRGLLLIIIGLLMPLALSVIAGLAGAILAMHLMSGAPGFGFIGLQFAQWVLAMASFVVVLVGVFRFTAPEPGRPRGRWTSAPRLTRLCALGTLGLFPSVFLFGLAMAFFLGPRNVNWPLIALLVLCGTTSVLAWYLLPLAGLRHLAALLRRAPQPRLVRFAHIEFYGLLISTGATILSYALMIAVVVPMIPKIAAMAPAVTTAPTTMPQFAPMPLTTNAVSPGAASRPSTQTITFSSGTMTWTTTAPAPGPLPFGNPLPLMVFGLCSGITGCAALGFAVAGLVLAIMSYLVLRRVSDWAGRAAAGVAI